jgi:hypothetical protein
MSRQAVAQSRQALAQDFMCSSSGCFSQALPQLSHALAQASQMRVAIGPCRETTLPAAAQISAQSAQVPSVWRWSFWPSATRCAQCRAHDSHSRMQSAQALPHAWNCAECFSSTCLPLTEGATPKPISAAATSPAQASKLRWTMTVSFVFQGETAGACLRGTPLLKQRRARSVPDVEQ